MTEANHQLLLAQIVLKAGDLSNTIHNFSECNKQGDKEVQLKLPISPMCFGQIGFWRHLVYHCLGL